MNILSDTTTQAATLISASILVGLFAGLLIWATIDLRHVFRGRAVDLDAPIPYTLAVNKSADGGADGVMSSSYKVENRIVYPVEFDTGKAYIEVVAETRVWDSGHREQVVLIGDIDFALTDASALAAAVLTVHSQLLDAEGLQLKAVRDA